MNNNENENQKPLNPKIVSIIDEIDKDGSLDFKNFKPDLTSIEKISRFFRLADSTLHRICRREIENAKKFTNFSLKENSEITPIKGKEREGEQAIKELEGCQQSIMDYMTTYQSIAQITTSVIENQSEMCVEDCEDNLNNIPGYDDKVLKQCLLSCFKGASYTARSAEKVLAEQADNFSESLDKL